MCAVFIPFFKKAGDLLAYDGSIKIDTKIDVSGFSAGINKMKSIAGKGVTVLKTAFATVTTGIAAGATAAATVGSSFEAAMSKVSAISGSTGKDLQDLSDKAKEMGAKTKFSASESAEALQYMAMAGWDTESMLSGIDGIMNLAAADGLDLATTSDIVTDALTAFGLKASDSSHFADVLAKASSSANTNVSMLGESFKYVAPLAGTMGYSVEDVSLALGLMANASVKGSMAGTSLKTALSNLAAPTDQMAKVMQKYQISLSDTQGNALPLIDVLKQLREKFGGLSETEQTAAASTLFGKEAMSGMLAIINASDSDFKSLTENINNADGAAQSMADTMQDNLQGQITILKSALEGLGNEIYEGMQAPLKNAAVEAQEYVNRLSEAFSGNGLTGLIDEAGNIFGEIAVKAAEAAPEMVNTAVKFIQSFVNGISDHRTELLGAAKKIVSALVDGLVALLPKNIKEPVKNAVKGIKDSFNDGGLKKAVNTLGTIIKNVGKTISNISKTVLPPFVKLIDFAGDNLRILIPALTAGVAAFKAWKIVGSISAMLKAHTVAVTAEAVAENATAMAAGTATAAYTAKSVIVGTLTGKVGLATAAQWLWNAALNANPIGLVVAGVTALVAGITALVICTSNATEENDELKRSEEALAEQQEKNKEIHEGLVNSYQDLADGIGEWQQRVDSSTGILEGLNDSIIISPEKKQELNDQMNGIQNDINNIATNASLTRKQLTDEEIQRLEDLFAKQKELAQKEIDIQSAYQEVTKGFAEDLAADNTITVEQFEEQATRIIKSAEETKDQTISAAEAQRVNVLAEKKALIGTAEQYNEEWYNKQREQANADYEAAVGEANKLYGDTTGIIADSYAQRATDLTGYIDEVTQLNKDHSTAEQVYVAEMEAINGQYNANVAEIMRDYAARKISYREKEEKLRQEEETKEKKANTARLKLEKDQGDAEAAIQKLNGDKKVQKQLDTWLSLQSNATMYGGQLSDKSKKISKGVVEAFQDMPTDCKDTMKEAMDGMLEGMEEKEPDLYAKASGVAGSFINLIRDVFDIHSPSRVMKKMFKSVLQGSEVGLDVETPNFLKKARDMADGFILAAQKRLNSQNLVARMKAAVINQRSELSSSFTDTLRYKVGVEVDNIRQSQQQRIIATGNLNASFNVDGRELAIAEMPYITEELAFE